LYARLKVDGMDHFVWLDKENIWVCFISVETVPKVGKNVQVFSTKPSGRSFCQLI